MRARLLPMLLLWVVAGSASAALPRVGEVVYLLNDAQAVSGNDTRTLSLRAPVFEGDTIVTSANAAVKIAFADGGFVYLRPATRFVIERFHQGQEAREDRGFFALLKGGFRFVTGLIGGRDRAAHRVKTPIATFGIRGTDYQARLCQGDCNDRIGEGVGAPADGVYSGTFEGTIDVNGEAFGPGEFGFTSPTDFATQRLPQPPEILTRDRMPNPATDEPAVLPRNPPPPGKAEAEIPAAGDDGKDVDCRI